MAKSEEETKAQIKAANEARYYHALDMHKRARLYHQGRPQPFHSSTSDEKKKAIWEQLAKYMHLNPKNKTPEKEDFDLA